MITYHRTWLVTLILVLSGVASSCRFILQPQSEAQPAEAKAPRPAKANAESFTDTKASTIPGELEVDAATDYNATPRYAAHIRSYLNQENFDQIDEIADKVREGKTRFSGGHWKLNKLYKGLSEPADDISAPDEVWRAQIARLKRWVDQKPNSITARVALAHAYVGYAWYARGQGYSDIVTEDGHALFKNRLATAESVLNDAQKLDAKCPHWYFVMQIVAKGQSWERSRYERNFQAAINFEPAYHYFYSEKAQYLLPRWFGEQGEWEFFAEETSKRLGGDLGSIIYYRIALDLAYYYKDRKFFTETQISWPKIKEGFEAQEQNYGSSMSNLNQLCQIAGQAGDRSFTQYLLERIGDNWDPEVWKTHKYFDHYHAWAYNRRP